MPETSLTWAHDRAPPVSLWVSSREARSYVAQGWEISDLAEPCPLTRASRARVVKPGSGCEVDSSPELAALHACAMSAYDQAREGLGWGPVWRTLGGAHQRLMDSGYHELYRGVPAGSPGPLEPVQGRVVALVRAACEPLGRGEAGARGRRWVGGVKGWSYEGGVVDHRPRPRCLYP